MKKKNIGIVWANPYSRNLGVAALAYSSMHILKKIYKRNYIDVKIIFIGSSKTGEDSIVIDKEKYTFYNFWGVNFLKIKSWIKILIYPKRYPFFKLCKLDYVFDVSEGDSFTDIYGNERFTIQLNSKKFFSMMRFKQILLPQTIGPFTNGENERKAFAIMNKMRKVFSRDQLSYNYTQRFLSEKLISKSIDLAFSLPYTKKEFSNGKINVGINISALLWNGGYTENNQFGLSVDYRILMKSILNYFKMQNNVLIHLVSHVLSEDFPIENDYIVCRELCEENNKDAILAPNFPNPIAAKSYISGMDFFIGARMHSCIAAFSSNVPVFPLAYSRKFNGLFKDTLQYAEIGDMVLDTHNVIYNQLVNAFNNRSSLIKKIEDSHKNIVQPSLIKLEEQLEILIFNKVRN